MSDSSAVTEKKDLLDVTRLVRYTRKINEIATLNKLLAPDLLRDFIEAMDAASTMLSVAIKTDLQTETKLKTAEAIAYLDKAADFLKERDIKDSAESRKKYIDVDPDVIAMRNEKARTEALVVFLKNKVNEYKCAHDDVKKIAYDSGTMTNYEGM